MGLLKHAVLPFFCFVHGVFLFNTLSKGKHGVAQELDFIDANQEVLTPMEAHLIGTLVGGQAALLINCLAGVLLENAHYRGMAIFLEAIFWSYDLYDSMQTGMPTDFLMMASGVAIVGLLVHSMEPGIFTSDKTASKKKK